MERERGRWGRERMEKERRGAYITLGCLAPGNVLRFIQTSGAPWFFFIYFFYSILNTFRHSPFETTDSEM